MYNKLRDKRRKMGNKGFSLIELIVVIAIMVILMALLVPNVIGYISTAKNTANQAVAKSVFTASMASAAKAMQENVTATQFSTDGSSGTGLFSATTDYCVKNLVTGNVTWSNVRVYVDRANYAVVGVSYNPNDVPAAVGASPKPDDVWYPQPTSSPNPLASATPVKDS